LRTEAIAGITTFFTMAYIIVVNPTILSTPGTGISFSGALTATVLLCFSMTLLMGLYARLPFAVAPGMGINAFFTYNLILSRQIPWPTALGMVFWSGVLFLVISATPLRVAIARAIPKGLRSASAVGIGLLLTFIGLKNAGFIAADPVTLVKMGHWTSDTGLCLLGLAVTAVLLRRKSPFAFLAGIFLVTGVAAALGKISAPVHWVSAPDFSSVFLKLDIWGALRWAWMPAIFSLMLTDLFDSLSTFVGVAHATGLSDAQGNPPRLKEGLLVDAWATLTAGIFGTSAGTAYIESTAGIEMGGRTGRTSVFTALCFLPCFFLSPVAALVPAYATSAVLIFIGALMFRSVKDLQLTSPEEALPVFLTIVLIPLTFSITQGILWGLITHVGLYCLVGRRREVPPMLWAIAAIGLALLWIEQRPLATT